MITGLLGLVFLTLQFATISVVTGLGTIVTWMAFRGMTMSLASMPAQTAALADLPMGLISRATSVSSIIRNLASSFGIAVMTVLLNQRSTFHHARISDALGPDNTFFCEFLNCNPDIGSTLVAGRVAQQSFVLAIQDIFVFTAVLTLVALIPVCFLKKAQKTPGPPTKSA